MTPSSLPRRILTVLAVSGALLACSTSDSKAPASVSTVGLAEADAAPVVAQYAKNVHANYTDCLTAARGLRTAVDAFLAAPSEPGLKAARDAWSAARLPYGPSEAYRFYGGPIDADDTGVEGELNAWPLDENFIDYTKDEPEAGIINRPDLVAEITKDVLRGENEKGGEKNIAVGFHAIEFLLWGQDLDEPSARTAGNRPFTDYVVGGTANNQERRRAYLATAAALLVEDLEGLVAAWDPSAPDAFVHGFEEAPKDAVRDMLTSLGALTNAELSGERMTVAYKNRGQEDEHSCFSDTTNADLLGNAVGIENVYLGRYGSVDGPGIDELVRKVDPALDDRMKREIAEGLAALRAMQSVPFDAAINAPDDSPERKNVLAAIQALKKQARTVVEIGTALGLSFELEAPSEEL